ncbi:hypothetical protein EBU71_07370 [bacterium]|nr:hypothetical protein [Candidatus Elulimicrobium humile]
MKFFVGFVVACAAWILIIFLSNLEISHYRVYDCGMAEWHPDIPARVKEECRRRAYEEWKNEHQKRTI